MADSNQLTEPERLKRSESTTSDICDDAIQLTNDDASQAKLFAVHLGYWPDPFVDYFCRPPVDRKPPEINRGYWARVRAVKLLLDQFLHVAGTRAQIINLGAGFDTLYWNLKHNGQQFSEFVEIDFADVTIKKTTLIKRHPQLLKYLEEDGTTVVHDHSHADLHGHRYHLVGSDLRSTKGVAEKLSQVGLDFSAPTVFICECVLVYMAADQSAELLSFLASTFSTSCFINYEQVNIDDKFGHIMQDNLHGRGISLAGLGPCHSLESQKARFSDAGWTNVRDWNMNTVYRSLPAEERKRIEHLEFFDELELITQLFQHYCFVFASKDQAGIGLDSIKLAA